MRAVVTPAATNNPPTVTDQSYRTTADRPITRQITASDPDPGQQLTYTLTSTASKPAGIRDTTLLGTVTLTPSGVFTDSPAVGETGADTFDVRVCDNGSPVECATGTMTVDIYPDPHDDSYTVDSGIPRALPVGANDQGGLTSTDAEATSTPAHGTVSPAAHGHLTYTPDPGYLGLDSFTYRICSKRTDTLCGSATVHLRVQLRRIPPTVGDDHRTTYVDTPVSGAVPVTESRREAARLTVTTRLGRAAHHGSATVGGHGGYRYTPATGFTGTDTFTVIGCDDGTPQLCDTGMVTIDVIPRPTPPPTPPPTAAPTTSPATAPATAPVATPSSAGPGRARDRRLADTGVLLMPLGLCGGMALGCGLAAAWWAHHRRRTGS